MSIKSWSALAIICAAPGILSARQSPVFRAQANYVEVDAIVADRTGALVRGLTADDFEVREGRTAQQIGAFSYVDIPRSGTVPGVIAGVTPVRFRADLPATLRIDAARIYLLYLNGVRADEIVHLRNYARAFVEQWMQPTDVAAVWDGGLGGADSVTISNDKAALIAEIDQAGFRHTSVGAPSAAAMPQSGLRDAVEWLSAVQGRRKSLILFSGGMTATVRTSSEMRRIVGEPAVLQRFVLMAPDSDFTTLIERADVHIYPCDIRGLVAASPQHEAASPASGSTLAVMRADSTDSRDIMASIQNMRALAEATGGLAMVNTNDYHAGFDRIVEDNSHYYLLGYESSAKLRPGEFRSIDVRLKRPGLTVRARKGYVLR